MTWKGGGYGPHDLGDWGERWAALRLVEAGWQVVDRNVCWGRKEIDLVCERSDELGGGTTLAFVEVKTRAGCDFGEPQEAVTRLKRREIEAVARYYLARRGHPEVDVRFDVFAIVVDPRGGVRRWEHIEDAWRPGD